jgi:hypothetical protein
LRGRGRVHGGPRKQGKAHRPGRTLRTTSEAEDWLRTGTPVIAEALYHPVTAAEQDQPRRKWMTEQLEAETATANSRQS